MEYYNFTKFKHFKEAKSQRINCQPRFYPNQNSFVCVCNSTYCDTVESVDYTLDKNAFYQEFITSRSMLRLERFFNKLENEAASTSKLNLTINRSKRFQSIFGFGGAMTDATVYISNIDYENLNSQFFYSE